MWSLSISRAVFAASVFQFAVAQKSVPQDLTAAFEASGVELQVSFTNNAVDGFKDGSSFDKDAVSKEPTFALGDSSGIATTSIYTIVMVDTTSDDARTLHFVRSNFKISDIVNIVSTDQPLLEYKAPGSFGETGDDRKYTFLMYDNPKLKEISELKLPNEGETFDVKQFQDDNGFKDASAGIGMVVKLGGGGQDSPSPSSSETPAPSKGASSTKEETSARATSAVVPTTSSTPAPATPTDASTETSQTEALSTSAAPSTADAQNGTLPVSTDAPMETSQSEAVPTGGQPTGVAPANSAPVPSTVLVSSIRPDTAGTPSASASVAVQTDSGASGSIGRSQNVIVASLLALAGLLIW